MSNAVLPARPSLEYLRKVAKERLVALRRTRPGAQLADALSDVAQEYGFRGWRALKAEVDRRQSSVADRFFAACRKGDAEALRALLAGDPALINARDDGHNASGLYFAAAHADAARVLIDAGADVNDRDDVNGLGVIGWLTCYPPSPPVPQEALSLLLERGARHHIFSAIALGDLAVVRAVIDEDPEQLDRRMSRLDRGQTPLHFAITRKRPDLLALLIELGADIEATDGNGQTPLEYAMLRGDRDAAERLLAAGARTPTVVAGSVHVDTNDLAASVTKGIPILHVPDIAATLRWYKSIGFSEGGRYPDDDTMLFWGMVTLGAAQLMFEVGAPEGASATLLLVTDKIQDLYQFLKARQMKSAGDAPRDDRRFRSVEFVEDLHEPIFGGLRFTVRDPNGYALQFLQEGHRSGQEER